MTSPARNRRPATGTAQALGMEADAANTARFQKWCERFQRELKMDLFALGLCLLGLHLMPINHDRTPSPAPAVKQSPATRNNASVDQSLQYQISTNP